MMPQNPRFILEPAATNPRIAAGAIGIIVGKTTKEDLLKPMFRQFWVGK
jgi:tRNA U34 5-carboxymethylaminomethyl modifying GTPase MnmE/TrmE